MKSNSNHQTVEQYSDFHCSAEWHIAQLKGCGKAAALIYPWSLRLSRQSGRFRVSVPDVAKHFRLRLRTAEKAFELLKSLGLFVLLESGQKSWEPSIYHVLTHTEWADKHPDQCTTKFDFGWEQDPFGQRLFNIAGGQVKFKPFQIQWYRKSGLSEDGIAALFETWFAAEKVKHQNHGKKWRKAVGYNFGRHLESVARWLKQAESEPERDSILRNAAAGRPFLAHDLAQTA